MKKMIFIFLIFSLNLSAQNISVTPVEYNSSDDDIAPTVTRNNKTVYFTSDRSSGRQKVFMLQRNTTGELEFIGDAGSDINDADQSGSVTLTPDGQYMIFSALEHSVDGEGRTDLYSARKTDGKWTDIQNLGMAINSPEWDSQPSLSSDGKTLYFSSDRPGGFGGTDIYYSKKNREGWTKAKNVGSVINGSGDDLTPLVAADNMTFSFASNRSGGFGGFDIYFTRIANGNFDVPKNAGKPINSDADEYYYYVLSNSNIAYFASSRFGGKGNLDIYTAVPNPHSSAAIVNVYGTVTDKVTGDGLGADIKITDLKTKEVIADLKSDDIDGTYFVVLQPGKTYSITADKKGYLFYSEKFTIPENEKGSDKQKNIKLSPIIGGGTRLLIFFDFDKSTFQDESYPDLERLVEFLNENPDVKIRVEGHTDDVGVEAYNQKLSEDRAGAVKNYLIKQGIDSKRIKVFGFGETKPLILEQTEEARAQNRRVEFYIE
jgi:outer membrane protein OmpA-like peptidoglycan-associated protein/Tol biopolymer transport system component